MRFVIAAALGCALIVGLRHGSAPSAAATPAPAEAASCAQVPGALDALTPEAAGFVCPAGAPRCTTATQCTAYCAGGIPVCSQRCCACAS